MRGRHAGPLAAAASLFVLAAFSSRSVRERAAMSLISLDDASRVTVQVVCVST